MPIEFDPINKLILITEPTKELTALAIYVAAMDWCDNQPNMGYTVPMKAIGRAPLGGGIYTDSIFILINDWKLKFWSGTYQAKIIGTLITDDESERTVPPDYGNVEIIFQVTSQGIISVQGSGVTSEDKQDIADLVESQVGNPIKEKTDLIPDEPAKEPTLVETQEHISKIKQHHVLRRKINGNCIVYFDSQGAVVMRYRMVKDEEGRIIELIPEEV